MLFSRQSEVQKWKFEQNLKIWKSKMAAACDIIFDYCFHGNQLDTTWFRVIESKNEACYMYQNFKSIGWIVSKVEGEGSDWPPPPPQGFV